MTSRARRFGLRVVAPVDLQGWRVLEIDATVPLTAVPACPADGSAMRPLCTFLDGTTRVRMRVGCCAQCGHLSYIDRPTAAWMNQFYLESWDADDVEDRAQRRQRKLGSTRKREKTVVTLAKSLPVDRARPVCEIGSGWGVSLKHLLEGGFSRVVGIEPSRHRADAVRNGLGVPVHTAPFESGETQRILAAQGPFSLILSNHAFEHTYDPGQVFDAASRLQGEGDYLIVAVPNQETEQVMSALFFLPHLHSFTRASLERTAARHGYVVADDRHVHPKQLLLVFRRSTETAAADPNPIEGVFDRTVEKYATELALDHWYMGLRRIWWLRRGGATGQRWMMGSGALERARWARWVRRHAYDSPRSVVVRGLGRRITTFEESPVEIRFDGPIGLFYK